MTPTPEPAAPRRPAPEVDCPACGSKTRFEPANTYRPFCSARCQSLDFGAWASENYRVAADAPPDPFEEPRERGE
jgi:endogenous inhibitor of DNA gyrase (YacG/DUF329 family)